MRKVGERGKGDIGGANGSWLATYLSGNHLEVLWFAQLSVVEIVLIFAARKMFVAIVDIDITFSIKYSERVQPF